MPLILVPYTLGTQLPAAPAGTATGGAFYYSRRKRMMNFILMLAVLVLC